MLEPADISRYFSAVAADELELFQKFLATHKRKRISFKGQDIEYICCGKGEQTMLFPPGGMGILPPEIAFRSISHFEREYRIIAPDIADVASIEDLCGALNLILDTEGAGSITVIGGSGAGICAQVYFQRNHDRVDSLVLFNTYAPKRERNKPWAYWLIRLLPEPLLKSLFLKKSRKLTQADIPAQAEHRIAFNRSLLVYFLSTQFDKKLLVSFFKLAMDFNRRGLAQPSGIDTWTGKTLVISAEDDGGFADTEILRKHLPRCSTYIFPKGHRHMAPLINPGEFYRVIDDFLAG